MIVHFLGVCVAHDAARLAPPRADADRQIREQLDPRDAADVLGRVRQVDRHLEHGADRRLDPLAR